MSLRNLTVKLISAQYIRDAGRSKCVFPLVADYLNLKCILEVEKMEEVGEWKLIVQLELLKI